MLHLMLTLEVLCFHILTPTLQLYHTQTWRCNYSLCFNASVHILLMYTTSEKFGYMSVNLQQPHEVIAMAIFYSGHFIMSHHQSTNGAIT